MSTRVVHHTAACAMGATACTCDSAAGRLRARAEGRAPNYLDAPTDRALPAATGTVAAPPWWRRTLTRILRRLRWRKPKTG